MQNKQTNYVHVFAEALPTPFLSPHLSLSSTPFATFEHYSQYIAPMLWQHFKVGFLDSMFAIFDAYSHPVVLIGHQATRWMAVGIMTGEVCRLDLYSDLFSTLWLGIGPACAR